ncbi:MAG: PAS domain S-box protein [Thermodesulfobacteriota bacterium]
MLRFKAPSKTAVILSILFLIIMLLGFSRADATQRLKVGVYNFAPLVGIDPSGRPQGLFVDILEHVAAKEGWQIEYVAGTWQESLERLSRNEIDLLACIAYSDERAGFADFTSEFLFLDWGIVFKKKGSAIKTVFDLEGKRIGVLQGSIYTQGFKHLLKQFGISARLIEKREYTEVFQAVDRGEVDAGINAQLYGLRLEEDYDIEATEIYFSPIKIRFAAPKAKRPEIITALDRHIAALKSDKGSVYYVSFEKWTTGMFRQKKPFPLWLKLFIGFIISAGLVAFVFVFILKRQMLLKTAALRLSEEKFAKVFRSSPDTILLTDISDGRIVEVNEAFCKRTGYSRNEAIGRTTLELKLWLNENDRDRFISALRKNGKVENMESAIMHRNGNIVIGLLSAEIIELSKKTYMVAIFRDITDRKRAEEELRLSEALFSNAFHIGPAGMTITRIADGKFIDVNESFLKMFKFSREEVIGHTSTELNMFSLEERKKVLEQQLAAGGLRNSELSARSKLGKTIHLLFSSRPITVENEACHLTTLIDITDRKRSEEALHEALLRQNEAVKAANVGLWDWDLVTNQVHYSTEWKRQIGYKDHEIGNDFKEWESRVHPDDLGPTLEKAQASIAAKRKDHQVEFRFRHKDGSYRWILAQASVIPDASGRPIKMTGSHIDITERKQTDEELKKYREKLEELVKERTAQIEEKITEIEQMNRLFVDRELKMVELKEKIKELEARNG